MISVGYKKSGVEERISWFPMLIGDGLSSLKRVSIIYMILLLSVFGQGSCSVPLPTVLTVPAGSMKSLLVE